MRPKSFLIICCMLFAAGCSFKRAEIKSTPPVSTPVRTVISCPLPDGYQLGPAIETARQTLTECPDRLDDVFMALLQVAKQSPTPENGLLIQDVLKEMIKANKVSETYTKTLYQKYFSRKFVSIPTTKIYNLSREVDEIKKQLKEELALKRIGMLEACNDRESYKYVEAEYVRTRNFLENLAYNEAYLKESN